MFITSVSFHVACFCAVIMNTIEIRKKNTKTAFVAKNEGLFSRKFLKTGRM